jgi:hypothetical protein
MLQSSLYESNRKASELAGFLHTIIYSSPTHTFCSTSFISCNLKHFQCNYYLNLPIVFCIICAIIVLQSLTNGFEQHILLISLSQAYCRCLCSQFSNNKARKEKACLRTTGFFLFFFFLSTSKFPTKTYLPLAAEELYRQILSFVPP